jgi:hypothetical protein
MKFQAPATIFGIKESAGTYEGRDFSSCTFHCTVDVKDNSSGRAIGSVTRPFKIKDASLFERWLPYADAFPVKALGEFELVPTKDDKTELILIAIKPVSPPPASPATSKA